MEGRIRPNYIQSSVPNLHRKNSTSCTNLSNELGEAVTYILSTFLSAETRVQFQASL